MTNVKLDLSKVKPARRAFTIHPKRGERVEGRVIRNSNGQPFRWSEWDPVENAFDVSEVPDDLIKEVVTGVMAKETAEADRICGRIYRDKNSLRGAIPKRDSRHTVGRGVNRDLSPGAQAQPHTSNAGSISYHALAQVGLGELTDEERNIGSAVFGKDEVQEQLIVARRDANTALDLKLGDRLSSSVANQTYDVTVDGSGDWADEGAASKMTRDIKSVIRELVPGADCVVYGPRAEETILAHDNLLASLNYYDGGSAPLTAVQAYFQQVHGITDVMSIERLYDAGTDLDADGITATWVFNDGVWIGYRTALIQVSPNVPAQDTSEVARIARSRMHDIIHARYSDIPIDADLNDLGVTLTEINSTL